MRKPLLMLLTLTLFLSLLTGCKAKTDPQPAPTDMPTAEVSPTAEENPEADASLFTMVGENAVIDADGKELKEKAYYDREGAMLLPVKPLMEAFGWKAEGPGESGEAEMKLTRELSVAADGKTDGMMEIVEDAAEDAAEDAKVESSPAAGETEKQAAEEVVIRFTLPAADTASVISDVRVSKDGKDLDIAKTLPFIDGTLYAPEDFFDTVFEDLKVEYDGESTIRVLRGA